MPRPTPKVRRRFWLALAALLTVLVAREFPSGKALFDELFKAGAEAIVNERPGEVELQNPSQTSDQ